MLVPVQNAFTNPLVALHEVTLSLLTQDSSEQLLNALLDRAVEFTGADSGTISILDESRKFLEIKAFRGFEQDLPKTVKLKIGEGVTGRCIVTGKLRNVGDTAQDKYYIAVRQDIRSELAVPLKVGNKNFGVISVDSKRLDAFNAEHEEYLQMLADYAAQIFTTTTSVESLSHRTHLLEVLLQISGALGKYADIKLFFEEVIQVLAEKLGVRRAAIYLYDGVTNELAVSASLNYSPEEIQRGRYTPGEGVTGKAFKQRKAIAIADISQDNQFLNKTGHQREEVMSFFAAPFFEGGEPRGSTALTTSGVFDMEIKFQSQSRFEDHSFLAQILSSLFGQALQIEKLVQQSSRETKEENIILRRQLKSTFEFESIIGAHPRMAELFARMKMAADSASAVLVTGESGTGKELIASALHQNSIRSANALVKINCAAIPADLLESELFGYARGAFTGAVDDYKGKVLSAHKGTLFLDEIGELDLKLQAKLLRVLQEKEFSPLGSNKVIKVDVRIIAATNANLEQAVKDKTFREDLFYRLNVVRLSIPPLRERLTDLPLLIQHLLEKICERNNKPAMGLNEAALQKLQTYAFPGNIRELENILERAVVLNSKKEIDAGDIQLGDGLVTATPATPAAGPAGSFDLRSYLKEAAADAAPGQIFDTVVNAVEKELIRILLNQNQFNKKKTSEALGVNRVTLDKKIQQYGLFEI
ncbi:transcriptional regulator, NifA subfamily, Fis Family [Turneriella parva DSM 21527]|uniref:Transcriptional regulator, NifA subfamily, Fis Family n=1 Tax=Turneriella parva (strain ATCC BAA-1111 / DSM 21527 / NCTC 11395 / H) TaxID=869212 RepID=I4B3R5_TURPD|nr:transcriptional regulator, NifA subfamily, Fis Family [Turneriella parva DSM 21527]